MTFAKEQVNNDEYVPGEEIEGLPGWHMTIENVRSLSPNEKKSFRGLPLGAQKDHPGYQVWNRTNHIAANWGFTYVNKDTEPFAGEGFVIKTPDGWPRTMTHHVHISIQSSRLLMPMTI